MKITMFQAGDGDCLLVRGADGTHILVDGGRKGSFVEHTLPMLDNLRLDGHELDLVYVSHIDNDHISGILTLTDLLVQWLVYDFQNQHNPHFKEPSTKSLRPPMVKHLWHNAFREMVGENAGPIEDMLILAGQSFSLREQFSEQMSEIDNLVTGVNEAVELNLRLRENLKDIVLNAPFNGKLMYRQDPPVPLIINGLVIRVLGPTLFELKKLRTTWNDFLESSKARINEIRSAIEEEGRGLGLSEEAILHRSLFDLAEQFVDLGSGTITVPNIASLTLLVEEQIGPKVCRILLAGDAGSDELLAGLEAHGLINPHQGLHVDVLKVQHHGAIANMTERFCKTVTADHYLFCSNGNHHNPEDEVLKALVSARLGAMANDSISPGSDKPFRFWFSSSQEAAGTTDQKKRMGDVEGVMKGLRKQYGAQKFSTRFLRHGSKHTFTV